MEAIKQMAKSQIKNANNMLNKNRFHTIWELKELLQMF